MNATNFHGQVTFPLILLAIIIFLWISRIWVGKALSDKGEPSSKRMLMFMVALTYCICDIMYVFVTKSYDVKHKMVDAFLVLILAGYTTLPQLVSLYRKFTGKDNIPTDETKTP